MTSSRGARRAARFVLSLTMALVALLPLLRVPRGVLAVAPGNDAFQQVWGRTDQPVASGAVNRTWMWGPEPFTVA